MSSDLGHLPMNMCIIIRHTLATSQWSSVLFFSHARTQLVCSVRAPCKRCTDAHLQLRNKVLQRKNGLVGLGSSSSTVSLDRSYKVWALAGLILWRSIPCCALVEGRWIRLGEIADNPSDRDLIWGTSQARGRRQVTKATNWTLADLSIESIIFATAPFLDTTLHICIISSWWLKPS